MQECVKAHCSAAARAVPQPCDSRLLFGELSWTANFKPCLSRGCPVRWHKASSPIVPPALSKVVAASSNAALTSGSVNRMIRERSLLPLTTPTKGLNCVSLHESQLVNQGCLPLRHSRNGSLSLAGLRMQEAACTWFGPYITPFGSATRCCLICRQQPATRRTGLQNHSCH